MPENPAWLVDASIYVFRPWFVRDPVPLDRQGNPANAVLGFLRFTYNLLKTEQPQQIGFAFDTSLHTSQRKAIYPGYKANRASAPDELKRQFQLCRDFLDALGIVQAASHHYEADDIVGAWAQRQRESGHACMIISGDKDLAQLVGEHDIWWDYGKRKPLPPGGVKKEFGVWPQQIPDQLALAGDAADNIPGVPGIGMATAAKLLQKFQTVDILLSRIPEIGQMKTRGAKRLQALVDEHQATVRLARRLTGIECEVPDIPLDLWRKEKDLPRLQALCELLGLSDQQFRLWAAV
ncbi:5'-3' exonuclease H3TH domain-containing protein [Candidatus Thiothrix sp. Deng01]|uniref:5'-3' exonuclease H3TH domain-containing protein n=1 Tax=Candidatus Thiothrix phosphatis TaxID=3112415 RepID=A0ABU6D0N8_9GAMM|nr:5'-3' exonuclease H3TH domain-containing protein [Candidatus Thiothrix sp. Deng01]MEB4592621.1 5'-3' exonuclease H3TH domain-containing protein [Candidatus Thiothrix sp. Deng01]